MINLNRISRTRLLVIIVVLIILVPLTALLLSGKIPSIPLLPNLIPQSSPAPSLEDDQLLLIDHTATVKGKVVSREGMGILVTNDKGQFAPMELSPTVVIYTPPGNQPSSDLKSLELNKEAIILLEFMDGRYQVVSISYSGQTTR